jgi:uncharacterized membrane protein YbhN (UPF0104 family)
VSTVVGLGIALACAGFVGARLHRDWPEARHALSSMAPGWLALAVVLATTGMVAIALGWRAVLAELGHPQPTGRVVAWYFAGEIGKYVPGTVWPIVGRAELATRGGMPRREAYRSVFASLALLYLACAFVAAWRWPIAYLPLVAGTIVAARWLPVRLALRYLPAWGMIGLATWTVARALDPHAPLVGVLVAAAGSWLAGFLALPVPGGVGVREAAFVALAPSMDPGVAATTALAARMAFVLVDSVGAVIAWHRLRR